MKERHRVFGPHLCTELLLVSLMSTSCFLHDGSPAYASCMPRAPVPDRWIGRASPCCLPPTPGRYSMADIKEGSRPMGSGSG